MVDLNKKSFLILFAFILLDQLSKTLVFFNNISLDLKIFAINFVKNTGAIWGFFQNSNMIFVWISLIAIGILLYLYDKIPEKATIFYLLILSGIIGNLMDRVIHGFVVDFIDFKIWPVFNFADVYIFV